MVASVELRGVSKRFAEVQALAPLELSVHAGECLCVLGEPGAGKTTLLRLIAGLEKPDEGDILLDGTAVTDSYPGDRDVAMVFDNLGLYPNNTVFDNIASPLKARRLARGEIQNRVAEVAHLLHIERLLKRRPLQLSGGERQRVAIGRALVRKPKVLLMDEPLSNLDALLRTEMRTELKRLKQELGSTLLYTTHDEVEAVSLGDRIAVLDHGLLQQVGTPAEIYRRPTSSLVARAIGTPPINLLEGVLHTAAGEAEFAHPAFRLGLGPAWTGLAPGGERPVVLGVRPEHVSLEPSSDSGGIPSEVYAIEPLGAETIVDLRIGADVVKALAPPSYWREVGSGVELSFLGDELLLFEYEGGARLSRGAEMRPVTETRDRTG